MNGRTAELPRVLVADDEPDIRALMVSILINDGYEVIEAGDGRAALELALSEDPDIRLLDVVMPVMDGFTVLGKLKAIPDINPIAVIMVTARHLPLNELRALYSGAVDYITKPWTADCLRASVRQG